MPDGHQGPGGSHPALYGWAGIEQHLLTYDADRIQGYAEDIDTLLVFVSRKLFGVRRTLESKEFTIIVGWSILLNPVCVCRTNLPAATTGQLSDDKPVDRI